MCVQKVAEKESTFAFFRRGLERNCCQKSEFKPFLAVVASEKVDSRSMSVDSASVLNRTNSISNNFESNFSFERQRSSSGISLEISSFFKKKVLVLEDVKVNGLCALRVLSNFVFPVWVNSGEEALKALSNRRFVSYDAKSKSHQEGPEMVFDMALLDFDILTGAMQGPEVAKYYRSYENSIAKIQKESRMPLMTCTSYFESDADFAKEDDKTIVSLFDGVIAKPIKAQAALEKFREVFSREDLNEVCQKIKN